MPLRIRRKSEGKWQVSGISDTRPWEKFNYFLGLGKKRCGLKTMWNELEACMRNTKYMGHHGFRLSVVAGEK